MLRLHACRRRQKHISQKREVLQQLVLVTASCLEKALDQDRMTRRAAANGRNREGGVRPSPPRPASEAPPEDVPLPIDINAPLRQVCSTAHISAFALVLSNSESVLLREICSSKLPFTRACVFWLWHSTCRPSAEKVYHIYAQRYI